MNQLSSTTFSAGVKDTLAVTDIYKTKSGTKVNSIQEISHNAGNVLGNLINSLTGNVGNILENIAGDLKVNSDALMSRLFADTPSIKAAFNGLSTFTKENVLSKLDGNEELIATVGGIASVVGGKNFSRISGLADISKRLTGQDVIGLSDIKSGAALYSGLVKEANQLGIQGALTSFVSGMTDNKLINQIVQDSIPDLIKYGDIPSISGILDKAIGKSLFDVYPGFAKDLAKVFKLKLNRDGTLNIAESYQGLITIFNVTDSGWNKFERENGADQGYRLSKILAGSRDHVTTFQQGGRSRGTGEHKFHAMVGALKLRTVGEDTRKYFIGSLSPNSDVLRVNTGGTVRKSSTKDPVMTKALVAIGLIGGMLGSST